MTEKFIFKVESYFQQRQKLYCMFNKNIIIYIGQKQVMLTEQKARAFGFKGKFSYYYSRPAFYRENMIWVKDKPHPLITIKPGKKELYQFNKLGKTFGMETTRYIQYYSGFFVYFQNETDHQYKGYCRLENIYMVYLELDGKYLLYLSNGVDSSYFFFKNSDFMSKCQNRIFKNVVQLNFSQKYEIIQVLGKGSFSQVYMGKNKVNNKKYAVKMIPKKDKYGNNSKAFVEEEKSILSSLDSEYVCRLIEFFENQIHFIMVIDFIEGRDLMTLLRERSEPFLFHETHFILKNILEGIDYIHKEQIIHRDLKPQNILINEKTLHSKIIDFGLSMRCGEFVDKNKYQKCGTMGYMAFEVLQNANNKFKPYDNKCDMLSFGIIMHMMLMGWNPLKGKNYSETVFKNTEWNMDLKKDQVISKYGQECWIILQSLLNKNPRKRLSARETLETNFFFKKPSLKKLLHISEEKNKSQQQTEEQIHEKCEQQHRLKLLQKINSNLDSEKDKVKRIRPKAFTSKFSQM